MPTYEYACDACTHQFEEFQSITAAPLRKCPQCGKSKLRRLIGAGGGVIFKGSGFYVTDYRSEAYRKSAAADSGAAKPAEPAGDAGAAPKSEPTPAAKAETPAAPKPAADAAAKPAAAKPGGKRAPKSDK